MSLTEILKSNRPKLSDSTLRTYNSIINSLYRKMHNQSVGNAQDVSTFFDENAEKVLTFLKDAEPNHRKTILASLVVLCVGKDCVEKYRKQMLEDAEQTNRQQRLQKKSETQKDNWISQDEVMRVYRSLERRVSALWKVPHHVKNELEMLQDFVILSLYVLIPPRRLLDYTAFKIRNVDKEKDNYMDGRHFVFNQYKTAKKYNKQEVPIPIKLKQIIQKWSKLNEGDFLLMDDDKPFSAPKLTLRLNRIFGGRRISVNQLRHTFITDKVLNNVPALSKLDKVAKQMGHSVNEAMLYKKV